MLIVNVNVVYTLGTFLASTCLPTVELRRLSLGTDREHSYTFLEDSPSLKF